MKNMTLKKLTEKHNELARELNLKTIKEFKISKAQAIEKINDLAAQVVVVKKSRASWNKTFEQTGTVRRQLTRMGENTVKILNLANGTRTANEIAVFVGMTVKSLKKRMRHLKRTNGFTIHVNEGRITLTPA